MEEFQLYLNSKIFLVKKWVEKLLELTGIIDPALLVGVIDVQLDAVFTTWESQLDQFYDHARVFFIPSGVLLFLKNLEVCTVEEPSSSRLIQLVGWNGGLIRDFKDRTTKRWVALLKGSQYEYKLDMRTLGNVSFLKKF